MDINLNEPISLADLRMPERSEIVRVEEINQDLDQDREQAMSIIGSFLNQQDS